ncbi:MAG: FtsW/RodA/SpoVE family cell cycle protein [Lachnospiraceae bacterium]|nr:FtsW/RodA/SpoVE family cell cycle protein [Lachnospiraceae bacterium]
MSYLFLETANIILAVNAACYGILSLTNVFIKSGKGKSVISAFLNLINVIIAAVAFIDMFMVKGKQVYLWIFLITFVAVLMLLFLTKAIYRECNRLLLNNMSMLFTVGMIMITRISTERAIRQLAIFLIVLITCMVIPYVIIKADFLRKLTWVYAGVGFLMVALVLVVGNVINGSKIAITVFGLTFQPSEAVKVLFIFYLAALLCIDINHTKLILSAIVTSAFVIVLVLSKDLGSALIFVVIYIFMVYLSTGNYIYLICGAVACTCASVIAYNLFSHIRVRVSIWLNPWADIDNKGYQIAQSLFSINSGGFFGTGLFKGSPSGIPFCETDFIFSSIAEELGLIFAISVILICISCFAEMMRLSFLVHDMFYRLLIYGIAVSLSIQTILTIGGGVKFIPLTGVTLPLVSYGGTSLLVSMYMYFIVQGIYIKLRRPGVNDLFKFHSESAVKAEDSKKSNRFYEALKPIKSLSRKKHVLITFGFFGTLLLCIGIYTIVFCAVNKTELINNGYNKQQKNLSNQNLRGEIISSDGKVLAYSTIENGFQTRVYPYADAFCHSVGYSSPAKTGIESNENYYLSVSGEDIISSANDLALGSLPSGNKVNSTLNYELQMAAHEALGDRYGAVIVTEVKTGKILVMLSHPTFDPNDIEADWSSLIDSKDNTTLINRVTGGLYPPGSTFKVFTSYEYLNEGGDVQNYSFDCTGSFKYDDLKISCYHGESHGKLDFIGSFAQSCNSSFANIGMSLDQTKFESGLNSLLFNSKLPPVFINNDVSTSSFDISTDNKRMQTSIGQGDTLVTPYHINLITMAVANGGKIMNPMIVDSISNVKGKIIKTYNPTVYKEVMSEESASFLQTLMEAVIEDGTAKQLKNDNYTVAGKTGSAEYNSRGDSHGWFTGYAPCDDPEIAITVIVEKGGTGSGSAVPLAKKVLDLYFSNKTE